MRGCQKYGETRCASRITPPNRHSGGAFDNHRLTPRGFLPRGLSNTCPQGSVMLRPVARDGQVSDKPKHERKFANFLQISDMQRLQRLASDSYIGL